MLPRQYRLVGKENFDRLKKYGRIYKGEFLGLVVYKADLAANSKIGFTVSLKVTKKATERNRIKRMLREIVSPLAEKLEKGYDLLFLARKVSLTAPKKSLEEEVTRLLKESKTLQ